MNRGKGIHGDTIKDKSSEVMLKVVAFAKDAKYGHSSVAFISSKTLRMRRGESRALWEPAISN